MKTLRFLGRSYGIQPYKYFILMYFALTLQSCTKTDDGELVTYNGRVLIYDGPEIGIYDEINTTYLKPIAGVEVFIDSCKPWSGILGGGCTPVGRIAEMDVTDDDGKYSITFLAYNHISYYSQIEYRGDFVQKGDEYSADTSKDIILVPRSLIK